MTGPLIFLYYIYIKTYMNKQDTRAVIRSYMKKMKYSTVSTCQAKFKLHELVKYSTEEGESKLGYVRKRFRTTEGCVVSLQDDVTKSILQMKQSEISKWKAKDMVVGKSPRLPPSASKTEKLEKKRTTAPLDPPRSRSTTPTAKEIEMMSKSPRQSEPKAQKMGGKQASTPKHQDKYRKTDTPRPNGSKTNQTMKKNDPKQWKKVVTDVYNCYDKGYGFPVWSISDTIINNYGAKTKTYCTNVNMYQTSDWNLDQFKRESFEIISIREPVNITFKTHYNQDKWKSLTHHKRAKYYSIERHDHSILPPNVAVYCFSPVHGVGAQTEKTKDCHILNVIGLAFDDLQQPDHKWLTKQGEQYEAACRFAYDKIFEVIFQCIKDLNLKVLVISAFGANNFAMKYPGGPSNFQRYVWVPCLKEAMKKNKQITVHGMGTHEVDTIAELNIKDLGNFPGLLFKSENDTLNDRALFVNAWDPFSIVGNGNAKDNSLDGWIGRTSACAVLSLPLMNPQMKADQITFV